MNYIKQYFNYADLDEDAIYIGIILVNNILYPSIFIKSNICKTILVLETRLIISLYPGEIKRDLVTTTTKIIFHKKLIINGNRKS